MDKKPALCKYILTIVGSHETFNRVYQLLNPLAFQDCLIRKASTHWRGIKGRMKRAGWDSGYLEKIHAN